MQHRDHDHSGLSPCDWDASEAEPLHTGPVHANDMSLAMQHDNRLAKSHRHGMLHITASTINT